MCSGRCLKSLPRLIQLHRKLSSEFQRYNVLHVNIRPSIIYGESQHVIETGSLNHKFNTVTKIDGIEILDKVPVL